MTQELASRKNTAAPTGAGVTAHGLLTGLGADDHSQYALADGSRGTFEVAGAVATHAAAADPHTGYQKESEKGAASGYASLNGSTVVPPAQLGTGSGGATKFLREDSTFQTLPAPTGTGFRHVTAGAEDAASKKVELDNAADVQGIVDETNGGTGQSTLAKGELIGGSGVNTFSKIAAPTADGEFLGYDGSAATTMAWRSPIKRVTGSSAAAGIYATWQLLNANAGEITSQTPQVVMTTTGVGVGTWAFKYRVVYRSGDTLTTNGIGVAVNHTGTTTTFVMSSWFVSDGGAAATGNADQVAATNAGQLVEGKSERVKNTCTSATAGVDTAAADMLLITEGVIVVTVTGSLELKVRSELAAVATDGIFVRAETILELNKIS